MEYYARISQALVEAGRLDSPLWERVQKHVSSNLDMEYDYLTIARILQAFVRAGKGSQGFYRDVFFILERGHYFGNEHSPTKQVGRRDGQFLRFLAAAYGQLVKERKYQLDSHLVNFMGAIYEHPRLSFDSVQDMAEALRYAPVFRFQNKQQIQDLLLARLPAISGTRFRDFIMLKNSLEELGADKRESGRLALQHSWSQVG